MIYTTFTIVINNEARKNIETALPELYSLRNIFQREEERAFSSNNCKTLLRPQDLDKAIKVLETLSDKDCKFY